MFVDSHCHLEMEDYDKDRKKVIERGVKAGLAYMLTVATEEKYFATALDIVDSHDAVYGAFGIHPHNSRNFDEALAKRIKGFFVNKKLVAYGEIGLDFYRNYAPKEIQINAFRAQIALARELSLPIIVHSREARDETLHILAETGAAPHGAVMHCFSYDLATAKKLLDMGFHLSIPGTITYKKASLLREIVRFVPLDRILPETDAPFLTPEPHRGTRNEPALVRLVFARIAEALDRPAQEVSNALCDNFVRLFLKGKNQL
ncbi:MAG TPA: TatD family hydrolase [Syntrophorhabdales bacterium]|nr:TatD family hydrolase [Syntrophorhabdales bacterium]